MFREYCRGVVIKELNAGNSTTFQFLYFHQSAFLLDAIPYACTMLSGHCPQDELPNEVNVIITEWVATLERKVSPVASKQLN